MRGRLSWLVGLLIMAVMAGCAEADGQNTDGGTALRATATGPAAALASPTPAGTPTPAVEPGVTFRNPVINRDFPDPHIIQVADRYYAYATNSAGRNIQAAVSDDLVSWEHLTDAMPALPSWAALRSGLVWAPEVLQIDDQFFLYYTARDKESDRQCIGVAVSDQPEGKFLDTRDEPLICQADLGGSIDASPFRDGDQLYLYWKNDGNCCGMTTRIYGQRLAQDGVTLEGEPVELVSNDTAWEGGVVEAPSMVTHEGSYTLFFSGNSYAGVEYAVGYAACESPLGPCEDAEENPILESLLENPPVIGPGHQTFVEIDGQTWIVYHAWEVTLQGLKTDRRFVWLDRLEWVDGKPVVEGPTVGVQPVPIAAEPSE